MSQPDEIKPNFILVGIDASKSAGIAVGRYDPTTEALELLTPVSGQSEIMTDFQKRMREIFDV